MIGYVVAGVLVTILGVASAYALIVGMLGVLGVLGSWPHHTDHGH